MVAINSILNIGFGHGLSETNLPHRTEKYIPKGAIDSFETLSKPDKTNISTTRAVFGYLTQEQIDEINKTRKLPKNIKITRLENGSFHISPNWFNITRGTHTIPEGYELRRNIVGFTEIVPMGEEGLTLRKAG